MKLKSSTISFRQTLALSATFAAAGLMTSPSLASSAHKKKGKLKEIKASKIPNTVKNPQPGEVIVKCAGIAKKGKNHCGANGHACHGFAKKDFDPNEWVYVRPEVCDATPGRVVGKKKVVKG